jgi:hypothetical protein
MKTAPVPGRHVRGRAEGARAYPGDQDRLYRSLAGSLIATSFRLARANSILKHAPTPSLPVVIAADPTTRNMTLS